MGLGIGLAQFFGHASAIDEDADSTRSFELGAVEANESRRIVHIGAVGMGFDFEICIGGVGVRHVSLKRPHISEQRCSDVANSLGHAPGRREVRRRPGDETNAVFGHHFE